MQCMEILVVCVAGGCEQVGRGNSVSYYEQFSVLIMYNEFFFFPTGKMQLELQCYYVNTVSLC